MSHTHPLTTTAFEIPGYRTARALGVVRGIVVRSRSIIGNIGASLQTLVGGNISIYTELCEKARDDAFRQMLGSAIVSLLLWLLIFVAARMLLPV